MKFDAIDKYIKESLDLYNWYIMNTLVTFYTKKMDANTFNSEIVCNKDPYRTYAITENGQYAGFILYHSYSKRQAYLRTAELTIYLRDEFIGKGVAKDAVSEIEKIAYDLGIRQMLLRITLNNKKSIKFFEKCGYEEMGVLKNAGEKFNEVVSVVFMQKTLERTNFI